MRRRDRNPAERLRLAVQALPKPTREAMLRGIAVNPIIVGAYVDRDSGGICPMLAAHRNGGGPHPRPRPRPWGRHPRPPPPARAGAQPWAVARALGPATRARGPPAWRPAVR